MPATTDKQNSPRISSKQAKLTSVNATDFIRHLYRHSRRTTGRQTRHQKNPYAGLSTDVEAKLLDILRVSGVPLISLVAEADGELVGHILFSPVTLTGNEDLRPMGLAPMAVLPIHQRKGIGTALVEQGLKRCQADGYDAVVVLGHADYYPRFGFRLAGERGITCEYDVPSEAFMVKELKAGCLQGR